MALALLDTSLQRLITGVICRCFSGQFVRVGLGIRELRLDLCRRQATYKMGTQRLRGDTLLEGSEDVGDRDTGACHAGSATTHVRGGHNPCAWRWRQVQFISHARILK